MTTMTAEITVDDVIADPQVEREMPKSVFYAIRNIHKNNNGEGATTFEIAGLLDERDVNITAEQIARCLILLRHKGMVTEHEFSEPGRLIVAPVSKN